MRYRLRTLLIVLALAPPLLSGAWYAVQNLLAQVRPPIPPPLIPRGMPEGITGKHVLPPHVRAAVDHDLAAPRVASSER